MADLVQYYGTGRRKASVARVFLRPGDGKFTVNHKGFRRVLRHPAAARLRQAAAGAGRDALELRRARQCLGRRRPAQADAVKMGISRALLEFNVELRKTLKAEGLLSRDARIKERKKYGQKGARKRFQFSKR